MEVAEPAGVQTQVGEFMDEREQPSSRELRPVQGHDRMGPLRYREPAHLRGLHATSLHDENTLRLGGRDPAS